MAHPGVHASAQAVRSNLVNQFNGILAQITTTSQDASFNGVNLLGGDQLKLTFNETGKSTLNITGVTFNAAGLGLVRAGRRGLHDGGKAKLPGRCDGLVRRRGNAFGHEGHAVGE